MPATGDLPQRLGLVGLGLVGRALGSRARAIGLVPRGYDIAAAARDAAIADGIAVEAELAALIDASDAFVIAVYDSAQLEAVIDTILASQHRPTLVCHCVTADAEVSAALAPRCEALGIAFAEMPLAGSSRQIAAGEAPAWVGASESSWAAARSLVEALAPQSLHVGPPGSGAKAKLATNLTLGLNRLVLAESLMFARSLGIDGSRFLDLLRRSSAYSRSVDVIGGRMVEPDGEMVSRIGQHRKDVGLMLAAARRGGIALPLTSAHAALLDEPDLIEWLQHDNSDLPTMLEQRSRTRTGEEKP